MSAIHRTAKWGSFTRRVRPILQRSLPAPCIDPIAGCPGLVQPTDAWDVAHRVSHAIDPFQPLTLDMVGPAHRKCNRTRGAQQGRAKQIQTKRNDQRLPPADSGW